MFRPGWQKQKATVRFAQVASLHILLLGRDWLGRASGSSKAEGLSHYPLGPLLYGGARFRATRSIVLTDGESFLSYARA